MGETDSIWKTPEGQKRFLLLPKWEQEKIIKAEAKRERKRLRKIRLAEGQS